uniref:Uncharacterized protein n=1 Tax=Daphnia magna TaxID=35525 RepID=A0A0P5S6U6_9CRUS
MTYLFYFFVSYTLPLRPYLCLIFHLSKITILPRCVIRLRSPIISHSKEMNKKGVF